MRRGTIDSLTTKLKTWNQKKYREKVIPKVYSVVKELSIFMKCVYHFASVPHDQELYPLCRSSFFFVGHLFIFLLLRFY